MLLDIEMPGPDAFEMADRLKHAHPEVRVIVLSAHVSDAFISASFSAGACAYFTKSDELEDIVHGIHEVMRAASGPFLLGPKVRERCRPPTRRLAQGTHPDTEPKGPALSAASPMRDGQPLTLMATLTPRELQVLRLIGNGFSRNEIAKQLCRSVKTVDGHQERLMRKLGIGAGADLLRLAIREGLAQA